jgi:predicted peptidase
MFQYPRVVAILFSLAALPLLGGCGAQPMNQPTRIDQEQKTFTRTISKSVGCSYLLYLPQDYAKDEQRWPLMLFLHGAGERGHDLEQVKAHGPPRLIKEGKQFPFIVVSPQCPKDQWWSSEILNALLDEIVKNYRVDEDRVYVTGLSMGGYGTWALAMNYPDRFAAIAPICGGGESRKHMVQRLQHISVWAFHGAKDTVVSMEESERLVNMLKACGGDAKLTIYPEAGHDSWTETYNNPALYEWLLAHRRKNP